MGHGKASFISQLHLLISSHQRSSCFGQKATSFARPFLFFLFSFIFLLILGSILFFIFSPVVLSKINFKKKKTHTHTHTHNQLILFRCVCFGIKRNSENILHHGVCLDWLEILVKRKMISVDCKIHSCDL